MLSLNAAPRAGSFLTSSQVATLLNVSKITVFRIVHRGELAYYNFGKARRYKLEDVLKYAEERRVEPWLDRAFIRIRKRGQR